MLDPEVPRIGIKESVTSGFFAAQVEHESETIHEVKIALMQARHDNIAVNVHEVKIVKVKNVLGA